MAAEEQKPMEIDSTEEFDGGAAAQGERAVDDSQPILAIPLTTVYPSKPRSNRRVRPRNFGLHNTADPVVPVPPPIAPAPNVVPPSAIPPPAPLFPPPHAALFSSSYSAAYLAAHPILSAVAASLRRQLSSSSPPPTASQAVLNAYPLASVDPSNTTAAPAAATAVGGGSAASATWTPAVAAATTLALVPITPAVTSTTTTTTPSMATANVDPASGSAAAGAAPAMAATPTRRARAAASVPRRRGSASMSRGKNKGKAKIEAKPRVKTQVVEGDASCSHHVIIVKPGECIISKMKAISKEMKRNVCIICATGMVSQAHLLDITIKKDSQHQGQFQLQTLNGLLLLCDKSESEQSGGLNATLYSDGQIFMGQVVGELIASSHVQIVFQSYPGEQLEESVLKSKTGTVSGPGQTSK